jgi:hypothetical protein
MDSIKENKILDKHYRFKKASKCESLKNYKELFPNEYNISKSNKELQEIEKINKWKEIKPPGYWKEYLNRENSASQVKTRGEYKKKYNSCYRESLKHDGEIEYFIKKYNWKIPNSKPKNFWTKEKCFNEALKYSSRKQFNDNSNGCYQACLKYKIMDEVCSHMKICGNRKNRLIYAYEFENNYVYIGLTYNLKNRIETRNGKKNDTVTKFIEETGLIPNIKELTKIIPVAEAIKKEGEYVEKYRSEGWIILNKAKTGAIGSTHKNWTKEECLNISKDCETKTQFYLKNKPAYEYSKKNNFLDECCQHMLSSKIKSFWENKENRREASLKCKSITDYRKKFSLSYILSSRTKNELFEFFGEMMVNKSKAKELKKNKKNKIKEEQLEIKLFYLDKNNRIEVSKKCKNKTEYLKNFRKSYEISKKINGELDELFPKAIKEKIKHTKEERLVLAKTCSSKNEYKQKHEKYYRESLLVKGEIDEFFPVVKGSPGYWLIKDNRKEVALECKNRREYSVKFGQAYYHSKNVIGELDEFFGIKTKPISKWDNFNNRENAAKQCDNKTDYCKKYRKSYERSKEIEGEMYLFFPNNN